MARETLDPRTKVAARPGSVVFLRSAQPHLRTLRRAGLVLGVGLGGFVDGIVLHMILQWHHMISGWVPPVTMPAMEANTLADGLLHAVTWLITVLGVGLLWRAHQKARGLDAPWPGRLLVGLMLAGWGLFNLVEGTIDHLILGIHHVRPGPYQMAYDIGFLVFGALLTMGGWGLARRGLREAEGRVR